MMNDVRVLILGAGHMGREIARVAAGKTGLTIVGACDHRPAREGIDLGRLAHMGRDLGVRVAPDLAETVARTRPDVAIQATCSTLDRAWPDIATLLGAGVSVVSIAEEMAYPACTSPDLAARMAELAVRHRAAVVGTGVNPGFVLDLLVIALTGVCAEIRSIAACRSNDLSPYGPTVLRAQGVGTTPAAFAAGVRDGSIVGHVGFPQSMHMIAAAVGWRIDRIEQTCEPIVSTVRRETPTVTVEPGTVAGCLQRAVAYGGGAPLITLHHPQQIRPDLEGVETLDRIEILGSPNVCIEGRPEIAGAVATAAIAVNTIPRLLNAAPGLYTMADLPLPAALLGDVRQRVHARGGQRGG